MQTWVLDGWAGRPVSCSQCDRQYIDWALRLKHKFASGGAHSPIKWSRSSDDVVVQMMKGKHATCQHATTGIMAGCSHMKVRSFKGLRLGNVSLSNPQ